jgi:hypothetical protein
VRWELYNLNEDEQEATDLSERESARMAKMQSQLESWLQSVTASLRGEDYVR